MHGFEVDKALAGSNGQYVRATAEKLGIEPQALILISPPDPARSVSGAGDTVGFAGRVAVLNERLVGDADVRRSALLASLLA